MHVPEGDRFARQPVVLLQPASEVSEAARNLALGRQVHGRRTPTTATSASTLCWATRRPTSGRSACAARCSSRLLCGGSSSTGSSGASARLRPTEPALVAGPKPSDGRFVCSPAFGGHPASIVPAAYSSVPKTGQNRRTSRPHLALRGTRAPPTCTRTCAFEGPLGSPRRAIQPSSREKTAHDLRVGELQWPPEDGENVTNRTVNAPLKTGQNAEIGNAAVRAASGERAARARLPITVIDRQSLGEALAWWRKSYAT